jgi:hypothetical protein
MPRVTLRDLAARLDEQIGESARLRAANERLQAAVQQQAERLRSLAPSEAPLPPPILRLESHCPVCFEPLTDLDVPLGCGHEFCAKCCVAHFASVTTCPLCRREATKKEVWRFRHPRLARHWFRLRGAAWPELSDFVLVTTKQNTFVGLLLETSDDKESVTIMYSGSAWELKLDAVEELCTIQHVVSYMPLREDGMMRIISNA